MAKLSVRAFALTCGIVWGLGLLLVVLLAMLSDGYGEAFLGVVASIYLGVAVSAKGALLALLWGFVDGFVCGAIFAWLYNRLM